MEILYGLSLKVLTRSQDKLLDAKPYNNSTIEITYQLKTQINQNQVRNQ